jgi:hypothetical protein
MVTNPRHAVTLIGVFICEDHATETVRHAEWSDRWAGFEVRRQQSHNFDTIELSRVGAIYQRL